jgi:hypothetical protein
MRMRMCMCIRHVQCMRMRMLVPYSHQTPYACYGYYGYYGYYAYYYSPASVCWCCTGG